MSFNYRVTYHYTSDKVAYGKVKINLANKTNRLILSQAINLDCLFFVDIGNLNGLIDIASRCV